MVEPEPGAEGDGAAGADSGVEGESPESEEVPGKKPTGREKGSERRLGVAAVAVAGVSASVSVGRPGIGRNSASLVSE